MPVSSTPDDTSAAASGAAAQGAAPESRNTAASPASAAHPGAAPQEKDKPGLLVEPSDVDFDPPLIQCLAMLFRLQGKPISTKLLRL